MFSIILFVQEHKNMTGALNTSAPNPETNSSFLKKFRKCMKIPFGLPTPKWLLKIGAVIIKTETELILKSRWVIPERLLTEGFNFEYSTLDETLRNLLKN